MKSKAKKMSEIGVTHWLDDFKELERITVIVSVHTGVSIEDLKSRSRKRSILYPRQIIMYYAMETGELTNDYVGEFFNRDHSTVINAVQQIKDLIDTNELFRKKVEDIGRLINPRIYNWEVFKASQIEQ